MKEFTVKDLAELLGVSKPTIQRAINAAAIEANREDGQTRYYNFDAAAVITAKVKPGFDFSACVGDADLPENDAEHTETPPQEAGTNRNICGNDAEHTETPPQEDGKENIDFMRAMLATIQEQLAAKDKQIAAYEAQIEFQNKQIKDYSERLKEAMMLTKGQQYISAADKAAELLEASGTHEEVIIANNKTAPDKKKSLWKRIFNK